MRASHGAPDCKQVSIGLVVTPESLPLAYEVFAGNRADVTTVEEIVEAMEKKYGVAQGIWILDRGMVSEQNIEFLRSKGAHYIVGTPKSQLRQFEKELLDSEHWSQVVPGVEVKMVRRPDGVGIEHFVLCRSKSSREKEAAMLRQKFVTIFSRRSLNFSPPGSTPLMGGSPKSPTDADAKNHLRKIGTCQAAFCSMDQGDESLQN